MRKVYLLLFAVIMTVVFGSTSFSQLSGTYTVPGSYASISAAITALNTAGVSGPVVFNIAAGYVETMAAANYTINITTNLPTATNTITFQKSGVGANPLLQTTAAGLGTVTITSFGSNGDAFIKLNGTDYITFDGIDMTDLYTGAVTTQKIEYGFMLCRANATDGCKNVTIKNCKITFALTSATCVSAGIYAAGYSSAGSIISATSMAGRHENIFIDGNQIYNTITGMYFNGTTDATSPYALYDNNIQVGVNSGNTIIAGPRTTTNATTHYGIYSIYNDSMKIYNNTIRVNTGNNSVTSYGIFTSTGLNSTIDINGNTVSDSCMYTTAGSASQSAGIYNTFGGTPTTNTNYVNIQNNFVQNCAYLNATTPTVYYIANIGGAYTVNISGNTVSNNSIGGGASGTATSTTCYGLYNSATILTTAGSTYNVYNNTVSNITRTQTVASTGAFYPIYMSAGCLTTNLYGNNINTITLNTTTSTMYCIYSPITLTGGTLNIYNNTISGITRNVNLTSGATYGIYASQSSTNTNVYGNTVSNINTNTGAATSGTVYGYYNFGSTNGQENFYNNNIYNITQSATGTGLTYGAYVASGASAPFPTKQIYGNNIYNITGGTGQTGALYTNYAATCNCYNNNIYNILSTGTTGLPQVYAFLGAASNTASIYNLYNNFVHELKAPNAAPVSVPYNSIIGVWVNGGSQANLYFNTIYLDATASGANFGSNCVWCSATPTLDLRNNILINKSTPNGSGLVVALVRNSSSLATYSALSNNNNLYAGTPGANNLAYYDYTNSVSTISAYRTFMSPRDAASFTENTAFVNTSSTPYDLHISTCTPTQCESAGQVISSPFSITADYDGNSRFPNSGYPTCVSYTPIAPDVGADEFGGIWLDQVAPTISYTALSNVSSLTNRSFTGVTITDGSGVNTASGTKPRCYFKRSTDGNVWNDNTSGTDGWKYVEANGTSSPFDFTIDYSILNGGTISFGTAIQYFVIAQDLATTPNIGINNGTFAAQPTSVALTSAAFPIGGTINQYFINSALSGVLTVGTTLGNNFNSITGTGGFFQALNQGTVSGNITLYVTTDLVEDGSNALNTISYDVPNANYTVNIVPNSTTERLISGNVAQQMIRINGGSYVTIDGDGGFGGKFLRFRNTNGSNGTFLFQNGSTNDLLTNCTIESNDNGALGSTATIIVGGTTNTTGNSNITISNNDIRDNSDASGTPVGALLVSGSTAYPNNNLVIDNNNIFNCYSSSQTSVYAYLLDGNPAMQFTNNSLYQTSTRTPANTLAQFGIIMSTTGSGNVVSGNFFGGTAPNCGGTPMTFNDGAGIFGFRIFSTGTTTATTVSGNTIANIDYTSTYASLGFFFRGIDVNGAPSGYANVTGNTIGSLLGTSITLHYNAAAGTSSPTPCSIGFGYNSGTSQSGSVTNNTIGGILLTGTGTTTGTTFTFSQIGIGSVVSTACNVTGNTIGGTGSNSIQNSLTATVPILMYGIVSAAVTANPGVNITGNTIQNMTNGSTASGTNAITACVYHTGTAGLTVNQNTFNNISGSAGYSGGLTTPQVVGIYSSSTSINQSFNQNTISGLNELNTGAISNYVVGTVATSSASTGTCSGNKIYGLTNQSTGGTPYIIGIDAYYGNWSYANNMITITNGEATDSKGDQRGISNNSQNTSKISDATKTSKTDNTLNQQTSVQLNNSVETEKIKRDNDAILKTINDGKINSQNTRLTGDKDKGEQKGRNKLDPAVTTGDPLMYQCVETVQKQKPLIQPDYQNAMTLVGFYDDAGTGYTFNLYYNSIYMGGSATTGAINSYCMYKALGTTMNFKNNLMVNARTNGGTATGKHYAMYSSSYPIVTNYNTFIVSNAATMGYYGVDETISAWRTSINGDRQSWSTLTTDVVPTSLFTNISIGDLHINRNYAGAWIAFGKGMAISGYGTDYDGTARATTVAGGVTDIGAHQFTITSGSNPPVAATEVGGPPSSGITTTYTLWNRNIASIAWGTGGTSYPSTMTIQYYSGVNPPSVLGGNYSNSYTKFTPTGTISGTTCNVTYYFGDNETYTITSPSSNTILAKFDPSSWEVFQLGAGNYQTQLTYNTSTQVYTAIVNGIYNFSNFALTDVTSPLPVELADFTASTASRDIMLSWTTTREINNQGFDVERRVMIDTKTSTYSAWTKVGNVRGNGTSNEQHTYSYKDSRLTSGKYQYRLKQIDFSGNSEYYDLHNPDVVDLSKPTNADVSQNYPNPSNPKSKIDYQIPFDGKVSIKVYDEIGREVTTLVNEVKEAGFYTATFDGTNLASGVYFYRLIAEGGNQKYAKTLKMILVK